MTRLTYFVIALLLSPVQTVFAQQPKPEAGSFVTASSFARLPAHPRLFASTSRIVALRLQRDSITQQLLAIVKAGAEQQLLAQKIVYPGGLSNMGTSRIVQGRIISLALAYRVFGDRRYLLKAKEELLLLAAVENWGTGHFLDVGEASLAAGIGYDWLYNDLTESEKNMVAEAIKVKALLPSLQAKEQPDNSSWVNGNFNWNPVCNGGLTVAALAIAETEPGLSRQVVDRAIKNIPIAGEAYAPDGAFAEGPSYWSYGTSFYVLAIEALRSSLDSTYTLLNTQGFLKTADYFAQMQAPSGLEYNYSDYHQENLNEPVLFWFARELNRPELATEERNYLGRLYRQQLNSGKENQAKAALIGLDRQTPFELLWWNPNLLQQKKVSHPPLQWTAGGLMPLGVMRSSWMDKNATYVALKGGTPDNSHGHMDAGSFILEANGVRWALDLGTENYNKMREAKLDLWNYTQNSNRWSTFRVGPEGHNILRFNNERQQVAGKGEVRQLEAGAGILGMEADLTSLYSQKATSVLRRILLHPDQSVSIQDQWTAKDSAVEVAFQWLTKAKVTKVHNGLLLQEDGKSLHIEIQNYGSEAPISVNIEEVSAAMALQDSPNPGLSRIVIKMLTPAHTNSKLFLRAVPDK